MSTIGGHDDKVSAVLDEHDKLKLKFWDHQVQSTIDEAGVPCKFLPCIHGVQRCILLVVKLYGLNWVPCVTFCFNLEQIDDLHHIFLCELASKEVREISRCLSFRRTSQYIAMFELFTNITSHDVDISNTTMLLTFLVRICIFVIVGIFKIWVGGWCPDAIIF
jgi:hypothetical protein